MYTEASSPRRLGDKAVLNSFQIAPTTTPVCVNFFYHMSGRDIGKLNVYTQVGGRNQQQIWTLSGLFYF